MLRIVCMICVAGLLAACATIPDVEYSYYLSKMNAVATVTQTVTCTPDGHSVTVVNTGTLTPSYSADFGRGPYTIRIRAIEGKFGGFADSDVTFGFTEDGRLKSVNESTTGQGETIIKSLVSLATAVKGAGLFSLVPPAASPCEVVKKWADPSAKGLPTASLTYIAELNFSSTAPQPRPVTDFSPAEASAQLLKELTDAKANLPIFQLSIGRLDPGQRAISIAGPDGSSGGDTLKLTLQRIATAEIKINAVGKTKPLWTGNVPLPTGQTYDLPIPTAALFGSRKLILALSDAGAITSVEYGKNTGVAGAANAATSIVTALTPETATAKAADLKGQADVIAQQARLNRCLANPTTCQ